MKTIIVDTYGADAGTSPIIRGALSILDQHTELAITLIGDEAEIQGILANTSCDTSRISIIHTTDYITNHEPATSIFTGREASSTALGLSELKKNEEAIGLLTPGNTGATLVGSIFRLGLVDGLKTPALAALIPQARGGYVCLVDCGANIDCTAKDLVNFAKLGSDLFRKMYQVREPRVALLNVGKESSKGNALMQEAYPLLEAAPVHFIGNVEGCDITTNQADVIVCDGVSGNVLLKNIEATGKIAISVIESLAKDANRSEDPLIKDMLHQLYLLYELNKRGGATFLGTRKPIIKMHGVATEETVLSCAEQLLAISKA